MSFPDLERMELPILQELLAAGGADQLRYLYDRLVSYFPSLTASDIEERASSGRLRWRATVQRAPPRRPSAEPSTDPRSPEQTHEG